VTETILHEADRLINGDRLDTYRNTDDTIVALWSAYLGVDLTVLDYANLMILLKIARTKGQYHRDSYVDIAGYAGVGPRLWEAKQEPVTRVWSSMDDIPAGVRVQDKDNDRWSASDVSWEQQQGPRNKDGRLGPDRWAPFTEIRETV
jgi:hypothetical protein